MNNLWTEEQKARKRAQMRAGLASPYRGIRLFLYVCFAGSGLIGTLVFFSRTLGEVMRGQQTAGIHDFFMTILHVVLIITMVTLFRAESQREKAQTEKFLAKQRR